jgi:hypothetical protein
MCPSPLVFAIILAALQRERLVGSQRTTNPPSATATATAIIATINVTYEQRFW